MTDSPAAYISPDGRYFRVLLKGSARWHQLTELLPDSPATPTPGPAHWQQVTARWTPLSQAELSISLPEPSPESDHTPSEI